MGVSVIVVGSTWGLVVSETITWVHMIIYDVIIPENLEGVLTFHFSLSTIDNCTSPPSAISTQLINSNVTNKS